MAHHTTATPGTDKAAGAANAKPVGFDRSLIPGSETLLATMAEGQREWLGFVAVRLEKDGQTIRDTLTCKRWQDVLAVNTQWAGEMMRDYQAEATRDPDHLHQAWSGRGSEPPALEHRTQKWIPLLGSIRCSFS
jgi:hypothetical protein